MNQDTAGTGTATSTLPFYPMVIGGQRVPAASGRQYETVDAWAVAADGGAGDVDRAVAAARAALDGPWGALTGFGRAKIMRKIGDLIARDADYLAELETRDIDKIAFTGPPGSARRWPRRRRDRGHRRETGGRAGRLLRAPHRADRGQPGDDGGV
jgi:hypothetical protein